VANYLKNNDDIDTFITALKAKLYYSLEQLFIGFNSLKKEGYPVNAIQPQAAMYLTVNINLKGYVLPNGELIEKTSQITSFLLNQASFAVVPFSAFGTENDASWYRISVGNCEAVEIPAMISKLSEAFAKLTKK
jgi:aspartate aminotransferase